MKTPILTVFALTLFVNRTIAQQSPPPPKFVYCEIVGSAIPMSKRVVVTLDFGQRMKLFKNYTIRDNAGNTIVFNTMVDALNYLGRQGWEFVQAYAVSYSASSSVYHYMMKKPFDELSEQAKTEFMTAKDDTKED